MLLKTSNSIVRYVFLKLNIVYIQYLEALKLDYSVHNEMQE
jgi:hypothetical protein